MAGEEKTGGGRNRDVRVGGKRRGRDPAMGSIPGWGSIPPTAANDLYPKQERRSIPKADFNPETTGDLFPPWGRVYFRTIGECLFSEPREV
eukprot:scaffold34354_cov172-Isochrysis_galbana.AAC.2